MAINKVEFGGRTLIDLTDTTATADKILTGYGAYGKDGVWVDGTAIEGETIPHYTLHWDEETGELLNYATCDMTYQQILDSIPADRFTFVCEVYQSSYDVVPLGASGENEYTENKLVIKVMAYGTPAYVITHSANSITAQYWDYNDDSDLRVSGNTVYAPSGYYQYEASASVASGTAGTPTATKGAVSNHTVAVTPSVTNTTGYITGGTKTGTAVTVSASELVSGSQTITTNDTYDVTNLASVTVNVSGGVTPTGTINITTNGTHDVTNYATANVNVSGGGSSKKQINFIDYDGTIVQSYSADEWANVTTLPSNPSHTGLVAQGWNWTKAQIDAQLTALPDGDIWIGQMYITESGDTEIDVRFSDSARLSPTLTICVNGTVTVDWGDNTTPDTVTGSSLTTQKSVPHTYASAGNYTIVIHVVSGSFQFYNGSNSYTLLRKNATTSNNENRVYSNCVKNVRIGSSVTSIGIYAFYNCCSLASITIPSNVTSIENDAFESCYSLESITIPSGVTSIESSAFYNCHSLASITIPSGVTRIWSNAFNGCYSLASITIPSGVTSIGNGAFNGCYSLASITIPSSIKSIGSSAFESCYSLESITIPSNVTSIESNAFRSCFSLASITIPSSIKSIGNGAFYNCYSLASITIPSGVTRIGNGAFNGCYGMAECHILPTNVPTLGTTVFNNNASDRIIYVPSGTLSDYQSATNWSKYASYMVEESA